MASETLGPLLSWIEFLAKEPGRLPKRNGNLRSATLFMFEWELSVKRQREEEVAVRS